MEAHQDEQPQVIQPKPTLTETQIPPAKKGTKKKTRRNKSQKRLSLPIANKRNKTNKRK